MSGGWSRRKNGHNPEEVMMIFSGLCPLLYVAFGLNEPDGINGLGR